MNHLTQILYVVVISLAATTTGDELLADWFAEHEASENISGDCTGGEIDLRQGEATIVRSNTGYDRKPYPGDYACGWTVRPELCDLRVECRVSLGRRGGRRNCEGEDYLRIMKGGGNGIGFHQKYCGEDSVSLKFSGDDFLKIVFRSFSILDRLEGYSGMECKIVCTAQQAAEDIHEAAEDTHEAAEDTREDAECECGLPTPLPRIVCPPSQNCTSLRVPWQVAVSNYGSVKPFCGGTLLSSRYVITAAHCLQREVGRRKKVKKLHMTLGDQDWSQNQEARSIRVRAR